MVCRLTLLWLLISAVAGVAAAQTRASDGPRQRVSARSATYSVQWQRLPLADAVRRLQAVSSADVLLDRRVDPGRRIDLELTDARIDEIVAQLAAASGAGSARIGRLHYLGPKFAAERLASLTAARRRDVNRLPPDARTSLLERRRIAWPQLAEPRGLVTQLLTDHGWQVTQADRIPHDLWGNGTLPPMALADQLTVLLAGFDLTFRIAEGGKTIEIVPVDWQAVARAPVEPATPRRRDQKAERVTQVYTLRVESQPVGKVLEQLGRRIGWQINVDEDALRMAGRSLDERVSFSVSSADEDQLLDALLAPARLQAVREGRNVRIEPR